jgi:hypothetical protein
MSSFLLRAPRFSPAPFASLDSHMFDHLTHLHKQYAERTRAGIAISLLLHALVLAAIVYVNETVRREVIESEYESEASWSGAGPMRIPGKLPEDSLSDATEPPSPADIVLPGLTLPNSVRRAAGIPFLQIDLPDTLELGRPETVRLALPPNRVPEDSVLRVRGADGIGMSPVSLGRARQLSLYGGRLVVQPQSPPLQLTDSAHRVQWHWTIMPTEPGVQRVYLQLDAPATVDGEPRIVTIQRASQDVFVYATPLQRISRFFSHNWTFFVLVTLFALASWARSRWTRG